MTIWSARLREELCKRATAYAKSTGMTYYESLGDSPVTLFPASSDKATHGNFALESFEAISRNNAWRSRLDKSHTRRAKALPAPHDATAKELDSCTSSDALLMNVFCYPGVATGPIATLLGVEPGMTPVFGVDGKVPLVGGRADGTEIDMRLGNTNVESKLTESSFTERPKDDVERYEGLYDIFDRSLLPTEGDNYLGYQLIRNVLAIAKNPVARFLVLVDARRPDLLHEWWSIHTAIRDGALRARCGFVTWQEIAAAAPPKLRTFLAAKYAL